MTNLLNQVRVDESLDPALHDLRRRAWIGLLGNG
jgi:hypothetical protein